MEQLECQLQRIVLLILVYPFFLNNLCRDFGFQSREVNSYELHFFLGLVSPYRRIEVLSMVLDGNSEHVPHAWKKMGLFGEKNSDL